MDAKTNQNRMNNPTLGEWPNMTGGGMFVNRLFGIRFAPMS